MRRTVQIIVLGCVLWGCAVTGHCEEIRRIHGVIIEGSVKEATEEGLVVETQRGSKTFRWETLSPATRHRYQPEYRANYRAILEGLPSSARTNVLHLAEEEPPIVMDDDAEVMETPEDQGAEMPKSKSLKLVDQVLYNNIEPFEAESFPGLDLRTPDKASYWGLQYGPGGAEILYFAFDAKSAEDLRDTVFIYGPSSPVYQNTVRQKALKKKTGSEYIANFKKVDVASRFGQLNAEYGIRFTYTAGRTKDLTVNIDVNLFAEDVKSRFVLNGQPADLVYGEGVVNVRGILDLPVLWIGLDPASAGKRLIGDLKMSRLKLVPKRGMATSVELVIEEADTGREIEKTNIKIDEDVFSQDYGIVYDFEQAEEGKTYVVRASIHLGPFLGEASCEEKIHVSAK